MSQEAEADNRPEWRKELPVLSGPTVTLREPAIQDLGPLLDLLSTTDATPFGLLEAVGPVSVGDFIERARVDRAKGLAFTYLVTLTAERRIVGAVQVRALDPVFETAEWEGTLIPSLRGTGLFIEAARLTVSFTFGTLGSHRIEARVPVQSGRAHGALRKLGAAQEGLLRRSLRRNGRYLDQVLWSLLKEDWTSQVLSSAPRVH